ncbi:MAG: hypothetical protein HUU06_00400 [Planctomycetaceae bacterium]|nr:hypothetical protein [Planctomycetota bacterium]NUN51235.1 hypothetical protein [Planctomycetaceae bacterium]
MIGALVPIVLLPRFSSFVGAGTYTTEPIPVEGFDKGQLMFWRGPLVGGAPSNPFRTYFEESHDASAWSEAATTPSQPVTTANTLEGYAVHFKKRWFRIRVVLAANASGVVGISLWMVGELEQRVD